MIDLMKTHSKQKQSIAATTKKQAFEQAKVNSMLHTSIQGDTLTASLYIEPLECLSNTADSSKGRMRFLTVRQGRRMRSRSLQKDTQAFIVALQWDISGILQKASREGLKVVLRLPIVNGVEWPDYDGGIVTQESFFDGLRGNTMVNVNNIKTIKSNCDYMATVDSVRLRYTKDDNGIVWIHSKHKKHGGFYLDKFNGELSPESIRMFHQQ